MALLEMDDPTPCMALLEMDDPTPCITQVLPNTHSGTHSGATPISIHDALQLTLRYVGEIAKYIDLVDLAYLVLSYIRVASVIRIGTATRDVTYVLETGEIHDHGLGQLGQEHTTACEANPL